MKKLIALIVITMSLLAFMPAVFAFESTLTLQGGVSIPTDDVEGENEFMGAWGLSWDAWLMKNLALGINPYFTNLLVKEDPGAYRSSIEGVDLYLKYRPVVLKFSDKAVINHVAPFVALGAGYAHHSSKAVQANPNPAEDAYMWVLPHAAAGISLLTKWNTTLDLGVKYNYTTSDLIDLREDGDWNDGYIMPYLGLGLHFGRKVAAPVPVILVTGDLARFQTQEGTPSAAQSYTVTGTDLVGNIDIFAPAGYQISIDGGRSWVSSASLDPSLGLPVMVRMTGENSGDFSGNIVNSSQGAANFVLPVSGTVTPYVAPKAPELRVSGSLGAFSTEFGTPSAPQSLNISGMDLSGNINVTAPEGYEISVDGGRTWVRSTSLAPGFAGQLLIRMTGAESGDFGGNIVISSPGAADVIIPVSGRVAEPVKVIDPRLIMTVVHFETYKYDITDADKLLLDALAEGLKMFPEVRLQVQGHTDSSGNDRINIPLGLNRANAVKDYLVEKGIDASRLEAKGFAATQPVADNETVEGRAQNRRAAFILIP